MLTSGPIKLFCYNELIIVNINVASQNNINHNQRTIEIIL